jgi:hypothetical protein
MMTKIAVKGFAAGALIVCSVTFASAQIQHRHHANAHRHEAYRALQPSRDRQAEAMRSFQAYGGLGYGGVPESPLIPIRPEVPPPVDPNEPGSGSYGAMLEGRNPAPSEP